MFPVNAITNSSELEDLGLAAALRAYCGHFRRERIEHFRREGIKVEFTERGLHQTVSRGIALCLYKVAQEGLRNVAKHAKTKQAWVTLEGAGDRIRPRVEDRGSGFPVESLASTAGLRISDHAGAGAAYERELRNPLEAWTGHEDQRGIAEPMKPARLLLGDDHALILTGIRTWLEPYYEVVGSAGDSRSLVGAALRILNGIDAARQIKKAWPEAKLLFLSMHSNPVYLREALEAARDGPSE
jgi:hypothetical protein